MEKEYDTVDAISSWGRRTGRAAASRWYRADRGEAPASDAPWGSPPEWKGVAMGGVRLRA